MALGYGLAQLARLDDRSATAITVEVGIQNGTLAIAIASAPTFLNNATMAIPAAIYSLLMFRSEEHTSELQSQSTISYAVFCLKKKKKYNYLHTPQLKPP